MGLDGIRFQTVPLGSLGVQSQVGGLTATTYFTRNWDAPELPADVAVGVGPVEGGATVMVGGRF